MKLFAYPIIAAAPMSMDGAVAVSCSVNADKDKLSLLANTDAIAAWQPRRRGRSSSQNNNLHLIRGGGGGEKDILSDATTHSRLKTKTIDVLHQTSFLIVASTSMVVFSPLPTLTRHLGSLSSASKASSSPQAQAVKILSVLSAASAAVELFLSPLIGVLLDCFGRKRPSLLLHGLISCANLGVVVLPGVWSICVSRMVNVVVGGFLTIVANAVIADLFSNTPEDKNKNGSDGSNNDTPNNDMGSVLGRQAACISLGFLFGSVAGGRLTEYGTERMVYGAALLFSTLATLNVAFRMMDSLHLTGRETVEWDVSKLRQMLLEAPLSSIQLLYHYGRRMRTLAFLLLLQSAPLYMGDVFQVFAKEEWGLVPRDFANLVATFGVLGIISNISLPLVIQSFGLHNFSLFAVLSSLLFPLTTLFTNSFRYVIIAGCLGLYGGTQKVGTSTAMASLATELGVPQGKVQGEKASLLAVLKTSMPLLYSMLFLKGKSWQNNLEATSDTATKAAAFRLEMIMGMIGGKLPFVLNIVLGICAFALTWQNL